MSRIKGKDTGIELILRKTLYHTGIRYRKNLSSLPGHPDIVLTKYHIAVFCDGDFFHGYDLTKTESQLKTNKEFWQRKIERNRTRDREVDAALVSQGYLVLRFWEHEIRNDPDGVLHEIEDAIALRQLEETRK